jgi:pyruvate formate lyase activating enzyme
MDDYTDLVMLDIKSMTEEGYQYITGQKNKETTFNVSTYREQSGKAMWLRYVLIPGLTDDPEILRSMGEYFKDYKTIEKFEIQPYHKMGVHKWKELGWEYQLEDARENTELELEFAKGILSNYFREVVIN